MINNKFKNWHNLVRLGLGLHGVIHVAETFLNIYEGAYYSACLSLLSSIIMLLGAILNLKYSDTKKCN